MILNSCKKKKKKNNNNNNNDDDDDDDDDDENIRSELLLSFVGTSRKKAVL